VRVLRSAQAAEPEQSHPAPLALRCRGLNPREGSSLCSGGGAGTIPSSSIGITLRINTFSVAWNYFQGFEKVFIQVSHALLRLSNHVFSYVRNQFITCENSVYHT
jgi:hypothetical protein